MLSSKNLSHLVLHNLWVSEDNDNYWLRPGPFKKNRKQMINKPTLKKQFGSVLLSVPHWTDIKCWFELMLVYFRIHFFFLKQPHAFTSMDKESFFSPFPKFYIWKSKRIKKVICIGKPPSSPPNLRLAAVGLFSLYFSVFVCVFVCVRVPACAGGAAACPVTGAGGRARGSPSSPEGAHSLSV